MNRLMDAKQPVNFCTSSSLAGYLHSLNGLDFYWVAFYAAFRDQEAKELAGWYPEDTLLGVELDPESAQVFKGLLQIFQ